MSDSWLQSLLGAGPGICLQSHRLLLILAQKNSAGLMSNLDVSSPSEQPWEMPGVLLQRCLGDTQESREYAGWGSSKTLGSIL